MDVLRPILIMIMIKLIKTISLTRLQRGLKCFATLFYFAGHRFPHRPPVTSIGSGLRPSPTIYLAGGYPTLCLPRGFHPNTFQPQRPFVLRVSLHTVYFASRCLHEWNHSPSKSPAVHSPLYHFKVLHMLNGSTSQNARYQGIGTSTLSGPNDKSYANPGMLKNAYNSPQTKACT